MSTKPDSQPTISKTKRSQTTAKAENDQRKPPVEFLWIDAQEEDPRDRDASREKQSFIRARHHRLKKESQMRSLKTSMQQRPAKSDFTPPKTASDHTSEDRCLIAQSPILCQPLEACISMAFPYLSRPTNQSMTLYLQHYQVHATKLCFPLGDSQITFRYLSMALNHPALVQILLSTSAFHRATVHYVSGAPPQMIQSSTQDAIRLRSETIKSLQGILIKPYEFFSEATLRVIAHIMCVEAAEANVVAVRAHEKAIKKIIDALGGLNNLGYDSLSILYVCDLMRGLINENPVVLSKSWKWEFKVHRECSFLRGDFDTNTSSFVGYRFFNSPWSSDLHPELILTLRSLQTLVSLYENVNSSSWKQTRMDNDGLLLLNHELLSLAHDRSLPPFQDTLRLAVLIYTVIRIRGFGGMPCADIFVATLQRSLQKSFASLESTAPDLLLWILFIGSLASRGRNCHSWFLRNLQEVATELSLEKWDCAVVVLQEYFFICRSSDGPVKEMWKSAFSQKLKGVVEE
ncbi:hypothetical protein PMG11_09843 [Penicillium brasilianum]|uniref:Tachykinin family protein n=1 Tax=Penicillium brasilianum TaxID=104259 RepID=A0A0F7U1Y2_PENBI|nr:hypothetical protein PMG11_09843 [Penicillium brasilianum]